jgi:tRNA U34 5-carboxymethylaminomethyl modifying enzyme MnmG/GidA
LSILFFFSAYKLLEHYSFLNLKDFRHLLAENLQIICDQSILANRIKIQASYRHYEQIENEKIKYLRKEESLRLPEDIDYRHPKLNLSNEAIDALNRSRPSNVRFQTIHA